MLGFRLLALLALASASTTARAEPLLKPPSPVPAPNDDDPLPPLVPPASDTLGGHFVLAANGGFVVPWGDLSEGVSATDLGTGAGFGLDLGFGLSRSVVVGLWGQYASYGGAACRSLNGREVSCSAASYALGPFVRYHIVQGTRFDPWILAGLGFRGMSIDVPAVDSTNTDPAEAGRKDDYSGVEWLRLALGGDYYPFGNVGFGPFFELDVGAFGTRPPESQGSAAHFSVVTGLRIVLDLPGK